MSIPAYVLNTFESEKKIQAIKEYRSQSNGLGLKEAKDDVDDYWRAQGWPKPRL